MFKQQIASLINLVRMSKQNDSPLKYIRVLKDAMQTLKNTIASENFNEQQSEMLLDLYATYKKESRDVLHDYTYGIVVKLFFATIVASLSYLFFVKGIR